MRILLDKGLKYLSLLWIFFIPYQIFFTSGISISLALVLFMLSSILLVAKISLEGSAIVAFHGILKRYWIVILLIGLLTVSFLLNLELASVKELMRWVLFGMEIILVLEVLRLRVIDKRTVIVTVTWSMLAMLILTSYQLFITPVEELNFVRKIVGPIFNDPDFIKERFNGVGKFNWLYGNSLRVHGVFANVSHFAFILGSVFILLLTTYSSYFKRSKVIILTFLIVFIVLSLVRSVLISLLFLLLISAVIAFRKRTDWGTLRLFLGTLLAGAVLAFSLSIFSANQLIFWSLIVRSLETVSFDGALFAPQLESLNAFFQTVNISNSGFNEYGGVGGRVNLLKITVQEVIVPNLLNLKFLALGFGPASLGSLLKNTGDAYFGAFNTVDNSYLQWIVELGIVPFVIVFAWGKNYFNKLKLILAKHWMLVVYILLNAFFFNLLPDIRMAMFVAVLIGIIFGNE